MPYCPKCGNKIGNNDAFCSKCGTAIVMQAESGDNGHTGTSEVEISTNFTKNKGLRILIISLIVFAISFGAIFFKGPFGAAMVRVAVFALFMTFASSILCIRYSRKCYRHKGKIVGIIIAILSGLLSAIVLIALVAFMQEKLSKRSVAVDCAKELRTLLKDPDSMTIRGDIVVTDFIEGPQSGVIIKYSAANSYGGKVTKVALFSEDLGYLGDYEDEDKLLDSGTLSQRQKEEIVDLALYYAVGLATSFNSTDIISGKSVASSIGCNYSEY